MATVRTHVMLPEELLKELDSVAGRGRRSEFIAEVLAGALRQRRQLEAFEAALAVEGPPVPECDDPDSWLRELRKSERDDWATEGNSER